MLQKIKLNSILNILKSALLTPHTLYVTLKAISLVSHPSNLVQSDLNLLLANGVVTPGIVVGSVLLPCDQLLRMEQLPVGSCPNLNNMAVMNNNPLSWDYK